MLLFRNFRSVANFEGGAKLKSPSPPFGYLFYLLFTGIRGILDFTLLPEEKRRGREKRVARNKKNWEIL